MCSRRLADRELEAARFGERTGVDEVEPVGFDDAVEHTDGRRRQQQIARVEQRAAAAHRQAAYGPQPLIGEDGARHHRRAPRDEHRRLQLTPTAVA